jgi:hypothetical protein
MILSGSVFQKEVPVRALTATAIVHPDHTLTLQVPADIPAGAHQVVIVLQEPPSPQEQVLFMANWPAPHNVGLVDPNMTFRREDIYGEDGR